MAALGRYELLDVLGQGGFATVYRAHDPVLDRDLAIKVLHPHLANDPQIADRFVREGRALARLRHPNLVQVHDAGLADGQTYLAMELIAGRTLAAVSAGRQMPLEEVAPIVEQVAGALDAVHAAGLVHRDIKPPNIIVADDGRAVLLDLGIARDMDQTGVTATGLLVGTPGFLAPEQVDSSVFVGPRTDVYQLGATVYTLLAGKPPYEGNTAQVLYSVAHRPPPDLGEARGDLPFYAIAAVTRAMAKDPEDRTATAGEFAAALSGKNAGALPAPTRVHSSRATEPPAVPLEPTPLITAAETMAYVPTPEAPAASDGGRSAGGTGAAPRGKTPVIVAAAVAVVVIAGVAAIYAFTRGGSDSSEDTPADTNVVQDGILPGGPVVDVDLSDGTPVRLDFTAPGNKRLSIKVKPGDLGASFFIEGEDERVVGPRQFIGKDGGFIDTRELPEFGKYWLVMEPEADQSGTVHVQMYAVPDDPVGDISPGGPAVTVEVDTPGENAHSQFKATAGQRVALKVSGNTIGMSFVVISTELGSAPIIQSFFSPPGGFMDTITLREAGTYEIVSNPPDDDIGKATLTLYDVGSDVTVTAVPGTPITVATAHPGQNALATFPGRAGERVSVRATKVASGSSVVLQDADGKEIARGFAGAPAGVYFEPTRLLPLDGQYRVLVDPQGAATEELTLTVFDVPPDVTAEVVIGGPPTSVAITVPGQNGRISISAKKGQLLSAKLTTLADGANMAITNAAGDVGTSRRYVSAGSTYDRIPVLADGDYAFVIDPDQATIGTFTLTVTLSSP